ncbi:hypothetical protein [Leptolyngbya sp. Cla-17]|uniref:hypothetical protein n=1 Tax=Leptolyngbya sp. Cla-17 TaxID=2803751 RepID=UPI0014927C06|nr:hypothetical protein [Leptolyngbya sp. Cla-17]
MLLASAAIGSLNHPQPAFSQTNFLTALKPEDFICYMKMNDGRVLNLTNLCSGKSETVSDFSTTDQRFLDEYRSFLGKRSAKLPAVQAALLQAQQNPQAVLQRAQAVCTALRTGQPQPTTAEPVGEDLFTTLAPEYFCPELDD